MLGTPRRQTGREALNSDALRRNTLINEVNKFISSGIWAGGILGCGYCVPSVSISDEWLDAS